MRRFQLVAIAVPSLLLFVVAACEDSNNNPIDVTLPDASLADTSTPRIDGATPDGAATDADAGPPAPVTVLVSSTTGPKAGVRVILEDATGLVIGETMTGANGVATMQTAPSMVTVLDNMDTQALPVTFMGVTPGDALKVVEGNPGFDQTVLGSISTSFTGGGVVANASSYLVFASSCSNSTNSIVNPISVTMYQGCAHATNSVLAAGSNNGGLLGFAFMKGVNAPLGGSTVNVGPLGFTAPGSRTFTASNLPVNGNVSADGYAVVDANAYYLNRTGDITQSGLTFQTPTGFADFYETIVRADTSGLQGRQYSSRILRKEAAAAGGAGALTSTNFTDALPLITAVDVSTANSAERPDVTITEAGATGAHSGYATLSWFNNLSSGRWTFVFPGDQQAFKVPALPVDATAFLPSGASVTSAAYVDGPLVPDYATAKQLPVPPNVDIDAIANQPVLPLPGTLKVSLFHFIPQ